MRLPTLYKLTSTGAVQEWTISVHDESNHYGGSGAAVIESVYGQVDGAKQIALENVYTGKNIGRSNETSYLDQAELDAKSQWDKKKKKGYVESIEDARAGTVDKTVILGGFSPMLAHKYADQSAKIKFPAYVQPKLDGHRCIAVISDGSCTLWSRTQKEILGVPHIARALEKLYPFGEVVLDGELYNHYYKDNFNELTSFIRQTTPKPGHEVVQYWVYDCILDHEPFSVRTETIYSLDARLPVHSQIRIVETELVDNPESLIEWFSDYREDGFEGAMVRNVDSPYLIGKRSYDLQKVKEFDDEEFIITNVVAGVGKMEDKGVFICATESGAEFKVKMVGELDSLRAYLDNPEDYIGRYITVKFQGKHKDTGIPRFGVGLRLREEI